MAFTAIDTSKTKDYISTNDPDPKNPTVWKLGVLDAFQWAEVEDVTWYLESAAHEDGGRGVPVGAHRDMLIIRFGLKGVDNFHGAEFNTKSIDRNNIQRQMVSDDFLRVLPGNLITELAKEIHDLNNLSEDQAKN